MVSYLLPSPDTPIDIPVLGEDDPNVITYSLATPFTLTHLCRNECSYCAFQRRDNLTVPYSTIKVAKTARTMGIREGLYIAGERPDKFSNIRSLLDLWGFTSYLDYVYTISELGFLEGLIPTIEIGFLSPIEMKKMVEVCASTKIMLDSIDASHADTFYAKSPGKRLELRLKSLQWAGKLRFPTVTGFMVGIGETKTHRKELLNLIAEIHRQYGTIHEVVIQNFVPQPGTPMSGKSTASKNDMMATVEAALNILPNDVSVTVPLEANAHWIEDFIKLGVRDLGRIFYPEHPVYTTKRENSELNVKEVIENLGYRLQPRFPLKKPFIKNGLYSKKLGQVFDAYRYKIKKESNEKGKEVRGAG
ncbi:7,8-didemethyl-8-hydroxy-5-deazariboflavin synthase subunit CofG [bacterium]|nr:7,8-didemethyl-8-hydroxy-5-deazariboflavin synthase subunit CofG [bacterium]